MSLPAEGCTVSKKRGTLSSVNADVQEPHLPGSWLHPRPFRPVEPRIHNRMQVTNTVLKKMPGKTPHALEQEPTNRVGTRALPVGF
jgi:hypothetical protein